MPCVQLVCECVVVGVQCMSVCSVGVGVNVNVGVGGWVLIRVVGKSVGVQSAMQK